MKSLNKTSVVNMCLFIYFLLKPFYFVGSGNIQVADVFIILAFVLTFMTSIGKKNNKIITKKTIYIVIFIIFICLINLIYFLIYKNMDFIQNTSYYIFILMGIIVLYPKIENKEFLKNCYYIFIADILLQVIFYLTGIGKYWHSTSRYMGTLKDPNQFAFFVFLCMMLMNIIKNILRKKNLNWVYILGIFLIFISGSTGMLLAIIVFFSIKIIINSNFFIKLKILIINKRTIYILFIVSIFFVVILGVLGLNANLRSNVSDFTKKYIIDSSIIQRTQEKFIKSSEKDLLVEDRNLDMLFNNWWYIFFGAGEGNYERFDSGGEIHSTLPSILFYYGIVPTLILLYWIYCHLRGLKFKYLIPYIAVFIESFTLLNQRQLFLWFMIMIAVNLKNNDVVNKNKE